MLCEVRPHFFDEIILFGVDHVYYNDVFYKSISFYKIYKFTNNSASFCLMMLFLCPKKDICLQKQSFFVKVHLLCFPSVVNF